MVQKLSSWFWRRIPTVSIEHLYINICIILLLCMEKDKMYKNKIFKKGIVFAVIVLFLGAGVVSSINVNETFNSQLNQNHIGLDSAVKVADAKLIQLDKSDFSIINSVETTDDDGTILFYVFNLQPQGYIVV